MTSLAKRFWTWVAEQAQAASIWLIDIGAKATGISISPVQVELANLAAAKENVDAKFLLMDAEAMTFQESFDVIWSVESISHYQNIPGFFAGAARLLVPQGTVAVIDWFKKENLTTAQYQREIIPIEKGMLVELATMPEYAAWIWAPNGLKIIHSEVLNKNCAKTWDVGLDIIQNRSLWKLAATHGDIFVSLPQGLSRNASRLCFGKICVRAHCGAKKLTGPAAGATRGERVN